MYNPHSTKHSSKIFNFKFQVQICNRGTHAFQMQVKLIIQDPFLLERIFLPPEWVHSCTSVKLGHTSCCVFKPICVTVWTFFLLRELAKSFASLSHMRPVGYINYPDTFSDCTDTSCMVSLQKPPQFSESRIF